MIWTAVVLGSAGCYLLKLAGLSLPRRVMDAVWLNRVSLLLPVALLAALIATQTFAVGKDLQVDARLAGVAVGAVAAWRRAPFLLIVALAATTTALIRLAR